MKSNEQKLIDLLVQSVITMRLRKHLQKATTEELINWIRDNLTKLGFNVQAGNQLWIDYDGAQKIAEDVQGKMRFFVRNGPEAAPVEISPKADKSQIAIAALREIQKLDFKRDINDRPDFYSGAPKFVRAWLLADEAIKKIDNAAPTEPPREKSDPWP